MKTRTGIRKELRVLVVDDGDSYSNFLKESSDIWDDRFEVILSHVHSAEEAISQLSEVKPDIIMVDAHLPDVNSLEFVEQCSHGTSALVLTSESHSACIENSALQHGAAAYLPKVEDPDEVEFLFEQLAALSGSFTEVH